MSFYDQLSETVMRNPELNALSEQEGMTRIVFLLKLKYLIIELELWKTRMTIISFIKSFYLTLGLTTKLIKV